jgi:hypothetical protein
MANRKWKLAAPEPVEIKKTTEYEMNSKGYDSAFIRDIFYFMDMVFRGESTVYRSGWKVVARTQKHYLLRELYQKELRYLELVSNHSIRANENKPLYLTKSSDSIAIARVRENFPEAELMHYLKPKNHVLAKTSRKVKTYLEEITQSDDLEQIPDFEEV